MERKMNKRDSGTKTITSTGALKIIRPTGIYDDYNLFPCQKILDAFLNRFSISFSTFYCWADFRERSNYYYFQI